VNILVLGGTRFMGRHFVYAALRAGHEVTLFNRGRTNPDLFPEAEKIRGNRDSDLAPLNGRRWDVALDTCGYVPRIVRTSASLLADSVEHYTFISSVNAYAGYSKANMDETAELARMEDETVEEVTGETYGPLKVLCETSVLQAFENRSAVLRCGLIVGPHDPSDRFTYWPVRIARGGEVLCPGPRERQVQFIDARDLGRFILCLMEQRIAGVFNVTGPKDTLGLGEFLDRCNRATGGNAHLIWVDETFVRESDAQFPLWVPGEWIGLLSVKIERALAAGLTHRPADDTIRDTLTWHESRRGVTGLKTGPSPERERELLHDWLERGSRA
jgi:2'-hydroxyisoflavone reductase